MSQAQNAKSIVNCINVIQSYFKGIRRLLNDFL